MALTIEYLNKSDLKPYAMNAKLHPAEQIEQIKKSITDFGFNDPIGIYGDNEVVEGHGRLLAVMEMDDVKEVPVIRLDHMSDEERRAYALVHNKLTMDSGFDFELLQEELKSLTLDMGDFGFDTSAMNRMEQEMDESPVFSPDGVQTARPAGQDDPYLPDGYNDDEIQEYTDRQESYVFRRRIIITYLPEQEDEIKKLLGVDGELKVVYDFDELGK